MKVLMSLVRVGEDFGGGGREPVAENGEEG